MKAIYSALLVALILFGTVYVIYENYQSSPNVSITAVNLNVQLPKGVKLSIETRLLIDNQSIKASSFFGYMLNFTNDGNQTIYVDNISTNSPGFSISSTYFSQSLPMSVSPGTYKVLYVAVQAPPSGYQGPVNITVGISKKRALLISGVGSAEFSLRCSLPFGICLSTGKGIPPSALA